MESRLGKVEEVGLYQKHLVLLCSVKKIVHTKNIAVVFRFPLS